MARHSVVPFRLEREVLDHIAGSVLIESKTLNPSWPLGIKCL